MLSGGIDAPDSSHGFAAGARYDPSVITVAIVVGAGQVVTVVVGLAERLTPQRRQVTGEQFTDVLPRLSSSPVTFATLVHVVGSTVT